MHACFTFLCNLFVVTSSCCSIESTEFANFSLYFCAMPEINCIAIQNVANSYIILMITEF